MNHSLTFRLKSGKTERGSTLLVVVVLISIMTTFVIANNVTLYHLKNELKLIDKQQQRKFQAEPQLRNQN